MRIIEEIGRLLKAALPYAIVSKNDQGFFANIFCYHEVQDALDAGHTSVYVKNGTYGQMLMRKTGTIIKGSRKAIISRAPSLASSLICNNIDYCTFEGLTFEGGTTSYTLININANYNLFSGCKILNNTGQGFALQHSDNMIFNCLCENNSTWGITIDSASNYNNIAGITTLYNEAGPVYMQTSTRNVVTCVQAHDTITTSNYVTQFDSSTTHNVVTNSIADTGGYLNTLGTNLFNNHYTY